MQFLHKTSDKTCSNSEFGYETLQYPITMTAGHHRQFCISTQYAYIMSGISGSNTTCTGGFRNVNAGTTTIGTFYVIIIGD